jgi:peptidoglycan/LPS O-acetylase OafA/YrhL
MTMTWRREHPLGKLLAGSHLPTLDGLRMIAVLMVVLYHAGIEQMQADLGVSVFFVLSGFLITWLLFKEHDRTGDISLKIFYLRRAFRLLPAYYVFLALALGQYYGRHRDLGDARTDIIPPSLFYYTNYFNAFHGHPAGPVSHTWSLAVEEQFYLLWPLAFRFFMRRGRTALIRFLVIAIVGVVGWRSFLYCGLGVGEAYVYNAFDTRFDNLAIGCLAAVLSRDDRFLALAAAASRRWFYPAITLLLLAASRVLSSPMYHYSVGFTVDAVLIAVAVIQLMQLADRPAWSWLDHPVPRYLGSISYPMYLYHGLCNAVATRLVPTPFGLKLVAVVGGAALLGTMSFYLIERPFLRLRQRLTEAVPAPRLVG